MKLFPTTATESVRSRLWRIGYNVSPLVRGTGSWMAFLSGDWHEVHLKLGLNLRTRNYVGTTFGGALFSAADPVIPIQLYYLLGKRYILWDKAARIQFKRPGRTTLKAQFILPQQAITEIEQQLMTQTQTYYETTITWLDQDNKEVALIHKTIYIAHKPVKDS